MLYRCACNSGRAFLFGLLTLVSTFSYLAKVEAQGFSGLTARIQFQEVDDIAEIKGWCINSSSRDRVLHYRLTVAETPSRFSRARAYQDQGQFTVSPYAALEVATHFTRLPDATIPHIRLYLFEGSTLVSQDSFPKPKPTNPVQAGLPFEYEGPGIDKATDWVFVIDLTKTIAGQNFYQLFYSGWQALDMDGEFNIRVEELPFRGRTTRVSVLVDEDEIFSQVLQPKYEYLEGLAGHAIQVALQHLRQKQSIQKDLDGGDLSGNGIF